MRKYVIVLVFLFYPLFIFSAKTLKTKNFFIHYGDSFPEEKVILLAKWAEGAYETLQKVFPYEIDPVHIEIVRSSDIPNGFALTIPFNKININIQSDSFQNETGFEDWIQTVLIHELSHIFELDARRGYSKFLRSIFGKPILPITAPNYTAPFWFHEGIAVFYESLFTPNGRIHSTEFNTLVRTHFLFQKFPSLSQITSYYSYPFYPYSNSVYLYGGLFFNHLYEISEQKKDFAGQLAFIHSGRFYYFFEWGIDSYLQKNLSYTDFYDQFLQKEINKQKNDVETIIKKNTTKTQNLYSLENGTILSLAMHPNQEILFFTAYEPSNKTILYQYDIKKREIKKIFKNSYFYHRMSTNLSGTKLYFTVYEKDNAQIIAVPFVYDMNKKKVSKISEHLNRMADFAVSWDEKQIIGIQVDSNGDKHLVLYEIASQKKEKIIEKTKAEYPFFLSSDKIIAFEYQNNKTKILEIQLKTKETRVIEEITGKIKHPFLLGNVLYFSCDKTGVNNIYSYHLVEKKLTPLTNLLTEGIYPHPWKNQLLFLLLDKNGYQIASAPLEIRKEEEMPIIENKRFTIQPYQLKETNYTIEEYSVLSYLKPSGWLPSFSYTNYENQQYIGFFTTWHDPLKNHQYLLQVVYNPHFKNIDYYFHYQYDINNYFSLSLLSDKNLALYTDAPLLIEGYDNYYQREWKNKLLLSYWVSDFISFFSCGLGGVHQNWKNQNKDKAYFVSFFEGDFYGIMAYIQWSNKEFYRFSIRKEDGISLFVSYTHFLKPSLQELTVDLSFSLPGLLTENSVISWINVAKGMFGKKLPQNYYSLQFEGIERGETKTYVRGYHSGEIQGYYYWIGSLEYTIPVFDIYGGWNNKPIFLRNIGITLFYDYGQGVNNSYKDMKIDHFYVSYGFELNFSTLFLYASFVDFVIGYAYTENTKSDNYYLLLRMPLDEISDFILKK